MVEKKNKKKEMTPEERFELVKRNTFEIISEDELKKLLKEKKQPVVYWGTAPTGAPHIGYMLPMLKVADLLKSGFKVKILLADIHAALDNTSWGVLEHRYNYYEKIIPLLIQSVGVNTKNLEFVRGSDFQMKKDYILDLLKLTTFNSVRDTTRAASEVVKNVEGESAKLSGLIYPLMQGLDEIYLDVDAQLGGTDQRKIFVLARENHPKLNYKPRIEIMHVLIPGLVGKKMSSSDNKTKIDLIDDPEIIRKKIKGAVCEEGNPDNGLLPFIKHVLFFIKKDRGEKFVIKRDKKFGGDMSYDNYENLEKDFIEKKIHPLDLKNAVAEEIVSLLGLINSKRKELEILWKKAYSN